jgi:hypothetical protein
MSPSKSIAALVASAAFLLGPGGTGEARAQGRVFVGPGGPVSLTPGYGYAASPAGAPAFTYSASYVPPYSYYAAIQKGIPARIYTDGFGAGDFPYYGRPYGRPTDPWSWSYISGGYRNALTHYYYPPLGY